MKINDLKKIIKETVKEAIQEELKDVLMEATTNNIPLQVNGAMDTSSPNGQLPQGEVSMNQIMGLMGGK